MKLSKPKSTEQQLRFWDEPLGNHGHVRVVLGDMAEVLTAKFFGGVRYRTDSTADYSPDVVVGNQYLEVKACGLSKQTFIYSGRVQKDEKFSKEHHLAYVIWWHSVKTSRASTVAELQYLFLNNLLGVFIVPWDEIYKLIKTLPEEKLNSHYGKHGTGQYSSGYRLNITSLLPYQVMQFNYDSQKQLQQQRQEVSKANRPSCNSSTRRRLVQSRC